VKRTVTLRPTRFSRDELAEQAGRERVPLEAVLSMATLYFASDLGTQRAALRLPRFKEGSGESLEVTLDLDQATWAALDAHAQREGVPVERVLEHAALYYLADVHSGKLTSRLADGGEEGRSTRIGDEERRSGRDRRAGRERRFRRRDS
jgi:hypothetical protein